MEKAFYLTFGLIIVIFFILDILALFLAIFDEMNGAKKYFWKSFMFLFLIIVFGIISKIFF